MADGAGTVRPHGGAGGRRAGHGARVGRADESRLGDRPGQAGLKDLRKTGTDEGRNAELALTDLLEKLVQEHIGLTTLYNVVDEGAWADLKAMHRELDVAVAACSGWPASEAQDDAEPVRRLTALNREITEGGRSYDPVTHLA